MNSSSKLSKSIIGYGLSIALAGITLIYTQTFLATVAISQPTLF